MNDTKKFNLPALPYGENDLSPVISADTVQLHYGKHHQAYFNMLNTLSEGTKYNDMSLEDVVVENTGFGYDDDDTLTVTGGDGEVEVELIIEDGRIVDTNVINGGFGFTSLPEVSINSDTGALARVTPVLKFTKVDDAAQLAQISQDAVVTVISCITK